MSANLLLWALISIPASLAAVSQVDKLVTDYLASAGNSRFLDALLLSNANVVQDAFSNMRESIVSYCLELHQILAVSFPPKKIVFAP